MIANDWKDFEVIATGGGEKLERWGSVYLLRPDPQVIWPAKFDLKSFSGLHAHYLRENGGGRWEILKRFAQEWEIGYKGLKFKVKPMGFKHTGLFPEQAVNWELMKQVVKSCDREVNVLNLFAYTGGASVALAAAGAKVTHVDAAAGMVQRAKENVQLSGLSADSVRYIVDDCTKFVQREIKRGKKYNAVIMDPPSYGRGPSGETWKIEDGIYDLVKLTTQLLDNPVFYLINSYTTGLQPSVMDNILSLNLSGGVHSGYEVGLPTGEQIVLPCGCSALWKEKA